MSLPELIKAANDCQLRVFPQKVNPKRFTIFATDEKGDNYFVTRIANGADENGNAKYCWAIGKKLVPKQ